MTAESQIKRVVAGAEAKLPNPYGLGFEDTDDQLEIAKRNWKSVEKQRIAFGNFAKKPNTRGLHEELAISGSQEKFDIYTPEEST